MALELRKRGKLATTGTLLGFTLSGVFLIIALVSYMNVRSNFQALQDASEDYLLLRRSFSLMQDAETGQRGYVLTGDKTFLTPFTGAVSEKDQIFQLLLQHVDAETQLQRILRISQLFRDKELFMTETIRVRREEGFEAAQAMVAGGAGKELMDQIRALVDEAEAEQKALIQAIAEKGSTFATITLAAMGLSVSALIFAGAGLYIGMRHVATVRRKLLASAEGHMEELREVNEALSRANEELQHFAYVASHDLQEPLRSISGYVQLLNRRYSDKLDETAVGYINKSQAAAQRMQRLIEDLLLYTRVSTKGRAFSPVNTPRVLDEQVANLAASIEEAQATIKRPPLPEVWGDSVQIGQLFQNLIGNAIKFRNEHPVRIEIAAKQQDPPKFFDTGSDRVPYWQFSVSDNGIGIDPAYQARLFKIFQRLHTRQEYPGTGVGLALCKRIVERHGGHIWLESEANKGTTFFFTLPVTNGNHKGGNESAN